MSVRCFFLETTDVQRDYLRRYVGSANENDLCSVHTYHNAKSFAKERPADDIAGDPIAYKDDPRWPKACDCGYQFKETDHWQVFPDRVYRRADTGELLILEDAPAGAIWYADWYSRRGPDGHSLMARTPGGDWFIDGRAKNCTMPGDHEHRCWVRHGTPPDITVDKNGNTCQAGAGSIVSGNYHGFLRDGYFT